MRCNQLAALLSEYHSSVDDVAGNRCWWTREMQTVLVGKTCDGCLRRSISSLPFRWSWWWRPILTLLRSVATTVDVCVHKTTRQFFFLNIKNDQNVTVLTYKTHLFCSKNGSKTGVRLMHEIPFKKIILQGIWCVLYTRNFKCACLLYLSESEYFFILRPPLKYIHY